MTYAAESENVPLRGVDDVERERQGKTVVDAWLHLEGRHGPTPARHVVSIETRDGAVYRFQRYGRDEYLAFYNRENADGSEFQKKAPLPEHVQKVREAIVAGEVLPDFEALLRAERQVGERDSDSSTEEDSEVPEQEVQRRQESDLRAGDVATDGGESAESSGHAARVAAQLRMAEDYNGGAGE